MGHIGPNLALNVVVGHIWPNISYIGPNLVLNVNAGQINPIYIQGPLSDRIQKVAPVYILGGIWP